MKKSNLKTAVMAVLLICFGVTFSSAQSEDRKERKKRPSFSNLVERMDENEDGKISKTEVKGRLKENFSSIDTDEDGFISEEEFKAIAKERRREKKSSNK